MRKYGKYEKRPEAVAPKQPKVNNVLLQTYFTSLLCLALCVTMFLGTSYAWFTSEVNNTANEIYVGTLKVGLYKDGTDLANSNEKVFSNDIRWEPGYTSLETIEIVNKGDLAFKYVLSFTDGSVTGGTEQSMAAVAKYFDVWVYDHYNKTYSVPSSFSEIAASSDWVNVGTLADVLAGTPVLDGKKMVTVRDDSADTPTNDGTTDGVGTADRYTIALHMKECADSSVMGCKISLNVKLVAYQMSSEADDLGNKNYDDIVPVSDADELRDALAAKANVLLFSSIEIGSEADRLTMNGGVLDGNGNTITYSGDKNSNGNSVGVVTTSGGLVQNLKIIGNENGRALYVTKLSSDLAVADCILSGAYAFNLNSSEVTGHTITFTDTIFKSWISYANVMDHAYFTGCTFEDNLKPYGDTTLTNCKFTGETLDVSALQSGETITLINCSYNGSLIEKVILTANSEVIAIDGSDALTVTDEKMVAKNG